jgi:uncharacterized protein YbcI
VNQPATVAPLCLFFYADGGYDFAMSVEREQERQGEGVLAGTISTAFVQMLKEHGDRGPTKCRTYIDDDLIVVLLRGGFGRMENTLFDDGKWLDVRTMRHAFPDTMEGRFTETIERLTGREVAAFMSASHQRPDLQIEAFVLDGGTVPQGSSDPPD